MSLPQRVKGSEDSSKEISDRLHRFRSNDRVDDVYGELGPLSLHSPYSSPNPRL